nr:unnamed protein product [Callosobruchus analis]
MWHHRRQLEKEGPHHFLLRFALHCRVGDDGDDDDWVPAAESKCDEMDNGLNDLKAAVVALKSEIKLISKRVNSSNTSPSSVEFEEVVQEEQDRLKGDRLASEKADVVKVVTHISQSVAVAVTDIRRISKYDPNRPATKPRPIKVTLPNAEHVLELIKKSSALKNSEEFKNISGPYDRTPR